MKATTALAPGLTLALVALVALLAAPTTACGGSPKGDRDRAIATAIEAIQSRDAKRYASVMVSFEDLKIYCPSKVSANTGKTPADFTPGALDGEAKILKKLRECADVDWDGAKEISRRGGEFRRVLSKRCGTNLSKYRDVRIFYALKNGDRVEVKLDDPVGVEGEYFAFEDEPRCRVRSAQDDEVIQKVDALAAVACACEDLACAKAVETELRDHLADALERGTLKTIGMELRAKIADAIAPCIGKFAE